MLQVDIIAKRSRNLTALQKIDGNVLEIVSEASHTALYKFDAASTKWERYAMEGAVFITRNCLAPFYSLIVLNKIGPDDFILDLSTVQKAKIQDSYVMLRYATGGAPIIMGFWLRDDHEREELLQSVTRAITASNHAGNTNTVSSLPSSLTMKLTAAAQQINNKKVNPVVTPSIPTPPVSYAAAVGIPKQPIPAPTPTTTTGVSNQASSSAADIMQAIGNGNGMSSSSSSTGGVVSVESASSGSGGGAGGAGMGLLKMLRAQPTPSTNNNSSNNNMVPSASTSSNSGQMFLTDREISAMKSNQPSLPSSHNHQGGSSMGNNSINVVSSGSIAAGSVVGGTSKGASNMLLAALQIKNTTTNANITTVNSGIASTSAGIPTTVALSTSQDTRMVPISLSALLGNHHVNSNTASTSGDTSTNMNESHLPVPNPEEAVAPTRVRNSSLVPAAVRLKSMSKKTGTLEQKVVAVEPTIGSEELNSPQSATVPPMVAPAKLPPSSHLVNGSTQVSVPQPPPQAPRVSAHAQSKAIPINPVALFAAASASLQPHPTSPLQPSSLQPSSSQPPTQVSHVNAVVPPQPPAPVAVAVAMPSATPVQSSIPIVAPRAFASSTSTSASSSSGSSLLDVLRGGIGNITASIGSGNGNSTVLATPVASSPPTASFVPYNAVNMTATVTNNAFTSMAPVAIPAPAPAPAAITASVSDVSPPVTVATSAFISPSDLTGYIRKNAFQG